LPSTEHSSGLAARLGATPEELARSAKSLMFSIPVALAGILAIHLLLGTGGLFLVPVLACAPFLLALTLLVRTQGGEQRPERILNQAPEVIGAMGVSISQWGSLDAAVRNVCEDGDSYLHHLLRDAVWRVDTRRESDLRESLMTVIRELPEELAPLRRSLNLLIAACEVDGDERRRMVDDANDCITAGLRELGESYCSGLNMPAMIIFSLVVMVPVISMSLLPLLSFSDYGGPAFLGRLLPVLILVAVPAIAAVYLLHLMRSNPFREPAGMGGLARYVWMLALPPVTVLLHVLGVPLHQNLLVSLALPTALAHLFLRRGKAAEVEREKAGERLQDSLLEIGNRLLSGGTLVSAMGSSLPEENGVWAEVSSTLMLGRDDEQTVLRRAIAPISPSLASTYVTVSRSAERDPHAAGRLCVDMGRMLQGQASVRKNIKNQLRGMMDMMNGTAAIFAPLILGISSAMMLPLLPMGAGDGSLGLTLGLYLAELSLISAFMTTYLMGGGGVAEAMRRFTALLPPAIIVFLLASGMSG